MVRSISEATIEHWASLYLTDRFAGAGIWWPARGEDIALASMTSAWGKAVLLEVRTSEWQPRVRSAGRQVVKIDMDQLRAYVASPVPVYFVLVFTPWEGSIGGDAAVAWLGDSRRTELGSLRSRQRWFGYWTRVVSAIELLATLEPPGTAPRSSRELTDATIGHGWIEFWSEMASCGSAEQPALFTLGVAAGQPSTHATIREALRQHHADSLAITFADHPDDGELARYFRHRGGERYAEGASSDILGELQDVSAQFRHTIFVSIPAIALDPVR